MWSSVCFFFVFFCKQKTAYEMRISDWSSDVCSSDLSSLAVPVLTCVHDSASLQFARILARIAVKKRLHQVSASRRDDARGRGRRKRKRPPGGGRSCTGCGEDFSAAASAAALDRQTVV